MFFSFPPPAMFTRGVQSTYASNGTMLYHPGSSECTPPCVTPKLVRDTLRSAQEKREWDRLTLLDYVTLDDDNYDDLHDLPLLPLSDGSWTTFDKLGQVVYICTQDQVKGFLGLEAIIMATDLSSSLLERLHTVAQKGTTQLKVFEPASDGVELLKRSCEHVQRCSPSPQKLQEWLEQAWSLVQHLNLKDIIDIPLLPICCQPSSSTDLLPLCSPVMVQDQKAPPLQVKVVEALELLHVKVIPQLPPYVRHHQLLPYLHSADGRGAGLALERVISIHDIQNLADNFNNMHSDALSQGLIDIVDPNSLKPTVKSLMTKLRIFKGINVQGIEMDVCITDVKKISPNIPNFPVKLPETLLTPKSDSCHQLAIELGAEHLYKKDLCLLALRSSETSDYSDEDISKLAMYIFDDDSLTACEDICTQLKLLKCVADMKGTLCEPDELYDPEDPDIDALNGQNRIPSSNYRQHLSVLRQLGVRKVVAMPGHLLRYAIEQVQSNSLSISEKISKSAALLRVMDQRSDCRQICDNVKNIAFVYGDGKPPKNYPPDLAWFTQSVLLTPVNIKSSTLYQDVLGSSMQLVECSHLPNVAAGFAWNQSPDIEYFLQHFKNVLTAYKPPTSRFFPMIRNMYEHLSKWINKEEEYQLRSLATLPSVFTEDGFKLPNQVYTNRCKDDLLLSPHMYPLPFELEDFNDLFQVLGCFANQSVELYLEVLKQVQEYHTEEPDEHSVKRDRNLIVSVLEKLELNDEFDRTKLLLPVENDDERFVMVEMDQCCYSEQECSWLSSEELGVNVLHRCVSTTLARGLGVKRLSEHLVGGDEPMEFSQEEPLTTRLHNLLRQYRDGVAIMKEMVQNADDAKATTVAFVYDERQNNDARTRLLNDKLGQWQGPALWSYNDAIFTEKDFFDLTKLGGGTKKLESTKIGKFGLGFCSVYNITDVPSLISNTSYVIFDPHQTYLGGDVKAAGRRYKFETKKNLLMLRKLEHQFKPFHLMFGCKIQEANAFDGTLFRLPLRTEAQASGSEISSVAYGQTDMKQLFIMFQSIIGELLLFTQHVKRVQVFHLASSASCPSEMQLLYESNNCDIGGASLQVLLKDTPMSKAISRPTPMNKANDLYTKTSENFIWCGNPYEEIKMCEISVEQTQAGYKFCGEKDGVWTVTWITSWHSGKEHICRLAENMAGIALPLGAVSVPVLKDEKGWKAMCLSDLPFGFYRKGHLHCFLPMPIETLLPIQINGCFEVTDDRTNILYQTADDRTNQSWNMTLLTDSITSAYHKLLDRMVSLGQTADTPYHVLWPLAAEGNDDLMNELVQSFYNTIVEEDKKLFLSKSGWYPISQCLFLEDSLCNQEDIGKTAFAYMEKLLEIISDKHIIELPPKILAGFKSKSEWIMKFCISKDQFYRSYFIPNVSKEVIVADSRDKLTLHLIDTSHQCLEEIGSVTCIPSEPHGKLRAPVELIDPKSKVATMYNDNDERFPKAAFTSSTLRKTTLLDIGMKSSSIPVEWVKERARSVSQLPCPECAMTRSKEILLYMEAQEAEEQDKIASEVKGINFLPVMGKPNDWPYAWQGDKIPDKEVMLCSAHSDCTCKSISFVCPSQLSHTKFKTIVGSKHLVLDYFRGKSSSKIQSLTMKKLGVLVDKLNLPVGSVLDQLSLFASTFLENDRLRENCHAIYEILELLLGKKPDCLDEGLRKKKILWTKHGFVAAEVFAISSNADCTPELFSASMEGLDKYTKLMKALDIKENYTFHVVMEAILNKQDAFRNKNMSNDEVSKMSSLLGVLFDLWKRDPLKCQLSVSSIHLPDATGQLQSIGKLCIDDGEKLSSGKNICLHKCISISGEMMKWLGITTKTRKRLEESSNRMHFGQNEPLTVRLKNILEDYPCDEGIMKEMLQNADDAGATEIAFIQDPRQLPREHLIDKQWVPLQGPALLVYNNKGFTAEDLQSIQNLGNSSKKKDPDSTGQYGIGFNAVYHLTDAPSFLTKGPEVPTGETLCMFDPHCRYDPWATREIPGIQLVDLENLKKDHPDSFLGYLEKELLQGEGTVFRLPLRTSAMLQETAMLEEEDLRSRTATSLISDKLMTVDKVEAMLQRFQKSMCKSLLFLKNVQKISVYKVNELGQCIPEYSVESSISKKVGMLQNLKHMAKENTEERKELYALNMEREEYEMTIRDSREQESRWCVVQQLGAECEDTVPRIVRETFDSGNLKLKPHVGVAVLLEAKPTPTSEIFTTSCYLPLPVTSGLPFSINGHFALASSRRGMWEGSEDAKSMWNKWLVKKVLVPATVHALDICRRTIFPVTKDDPKSMKEKEFHHKIASFYKNLPRIEDASSPIWKEFTTWFYEYVRDCQVFFFDVFIPASDMHQGIRQRDRDGILEWHAFRESGSHFPVHFSSYQSTTNVEKVYFSSYQHTTNVEDTFRRLGMKIGNSEMYWRMYKTDENYEYRLLTPDNALSFLSSWNGDFPDKCKPNLQQTVGQTPFLNSNNVKNMLAYVTIGESFKDCIPNLPLLLTNDTVLRCFSEQEPVFITPYCFLLPKNGKEFVAEILALDIQKNIDFQQSNVLKDFNLKDLSDRLSSVLDISYQCQDAVIPVKESSIPNNEWIKHLWRFISTRTDSQRSIFCWPNAKTHILQTLGSWAIYPITVKNMIHLIPVNNAWRVMNMTGVALDSAFRSIPIPQPALIHDTVRKEIELAATMEKPEAVLEILCFYNNEIKDYIANDPTQSASDILEYLGNNCRSHGLSRHKIAALDIFTDIAGQNCSLKGKRLILPSAINLRSMNKLAWDNHFAILNRSVSSNIITLYKYIDENILEDNLDIYAQFILPNLHHLDDHSRINYMKTLRKQSMLPDYRSNQQFWNESQKQVVSVLRITKFLNLNGKLETAEHFYDASHPLFIIMNVSNIPDEWSDPDWIPFLKLSGMIHEVTCEKYVEFAKSLKVDDHQVENKSRRLVDYLRVEFVDSIRDIEFLMPSTVKNLEQLEKVLPRFKTASGLVSFSKSVHCKFGRLLWSAASLLPEYATELCRQLKEKLQVVNTAPTDLVIKHITALGQTLQGKTLVTKEELAPVMEEIYEYLHINSTTSINKLDDEIPLIYLDNHRVLVSAKLVVEHLETEIPPYLYKAPSLFGKYFCTFKSLGMQENPNCDTYAEVLKRVYSASQGQKLNPDEIKKITLALNGMLKHEDELDKLSVDILYLPTVDLTMHDSSKMLVADNQELLEVTQGKIQEPLFLGFNILNIERDNGKFVKHLPKKMQPKFLSDIVQEELADGEEVKPTPTFLQLKEVLSCQSFQTAILRVINHYKVRDACGLTDTEKQEILASLNQVHVKQIKTIKITRRLQGCELPQKTNPYHIQYNSNCATKSLHLYFPETISSNVILMAVSKMIRILLAIDKAEIMSTLTVICGCLMKPQDIHKLLDSDNIKDYKDQSSSSYQLYSANIGSYLDESFLHLLDNAFGQFHDGELVCLKKYGCVNDGDDEIQNKDNIPEDVKDDGDDDEVDNIFIIVQVCRLVRQSPDSCMFDVYEVQIDEDSLIQVKAHQLYKFARKSTKSLLPSSEPQLKSEEEVVSEKEQMKRIRIRLKEIWQVKDDLERRHLIRRLWLKWHPDKNPEQVELCTQLFQYLQYIVGRLERGLTVDDEEQMSDASPGPSQAYSRTFRPPSAFYRRTFGRSRERYESSASGSSYQNEHWSRSSSSRGDRREAQKWWRHADHDLQEAARRTGGAPSWALYICHQAAEKFLKACLYKSNRSESFDWRGKTPTVSGLPP